MYKHFLADHLGWAIKWDSTGKVESTLPVISMNQVEHIPSWGMFLSYWNQHFPKIKIQQPREDICAQCYMFANSFRFKKRILQHDPSASDKESSDDDGASTNNDIVIRDAAKLLNEELVVYLSACMQTS